VGAADVARAVRSCWASVFAPDPLRRAAACGVPVGRLADFAVLIQPQIDPEFGGVARDGRVEGVIGSPAGLLSGWTPGTSLPPDVVRAAAGLSERLPGCVIEWAHARGRVHLLQIRRNDGTVPSREEEPPGRGERIPGEVVVPGDAVGRLAYCRPFEPVPDGRILVVDRPLRAFAPLLFGARGLVVRGGPRGSHLAEVARSLGVPTMIAPELDPAFSGRDAAMTASTSGSSGFVLLDPGL
jgi:phosphoenolpyruvate synthase/pyruvate phosphate dikinase